MGLLILELHVDVSHRTDHFSKWYLTKHLFFEIQLLNNIVGFSVCQILE